MTTRFGLPSGSRLREVSEDLDVAPVGRIAVLGLDVGAARVVELDLGGVDDDVGVGELAELADLGLVKAAWAGPRRPRTTISSTPDSASWSIA